MVSELDTRIEEAQEAAKTEIENKAQQAYQDLYEQLMLEVKTTITDEYLKEIEESNLEDKKKLDSYWREPSNIKRLIRETFPEDPLTAVAVAQCESGIKATAYNPNNRNGTVDRGVMQINSTHDERMKRLYFIRKNN